MVMQTDKADTNSRAAYIFAGILAVLALGLAIYFFVRTNDSGNKPAQKQPAQEEPEVAPAAVPEGWSTYGDKDSSITFAYPVDWKITSSAKELKNAGSTIVAALEAPGDTTVSVSLIRAPKGQKTLSTLDDWKKTADKAGIDYADLKTVDCPYTCFGYTWSNQGTVVLSYQVLGKGNSASLTVRPAATTQKPAVEQLVSTIRF